MTKYVADIEALAKGYDKKRGFRKSELEEIIGYIFQYGPVEDTRWALDVGCGTGRLLVPLSERAKAQFVGVDISLTMLKQAKKKIRELSLTDKCHLVLADGQSVPFRCNVFDFVMVVQTLHYFRNMEVAVDEIGRVTTGDSNVLVISCSHDQIRSTIDVAYFPGLVEIDTARVPDLPVIKDLFNHRGFHLKSTIEVCRRVDASSVQELSMKIREKPYSSYTLFNEEDFQRRLKKFEKNLLKRYGEGDISYLICETMVFFSGKTSNIYISCK